MSSPSITEDAGHPGHERSRGESDHAALVSAERHALPWRQVFLIALICFGVWFVLDAPSLQQSAIDSPVGFRRTVSMDVTGPVAALSRTLRFSAPVSVADSAMGRSVGGGPALAKLSAAAEKRLKALPLVPVAVASPNSVLSPLFPTEKTAAIPALPTDPTPANQLRVLVIGDSIGLDLGQPLVADLNATGVVNAHLDGYVDTGLSRLDYFDWPAELRIDLANHQPQLVVIMMGANDDQSITGGAGNIVYGSPQWTAAYGARVNDFILQAMGSGAHVIWVGMPTMEDPNLNQRLQGINQIDESILGQYPGSAYFLPTVHSLGGPGGKYAAFLPNSAGVEENVRTTDGIHLTPAGGELLSQNVIATMKSQFHLNLQATPSG